MWIRDTAEDMVLENVGPLRDERVLVPQGTRLVVDGIGLRQSYPSLCMHALTASPRPQPAHLPRS